MTDRFWSKTTKSQALKMMRLGKTSAFISKKLGVKASTLSNWRKVAGLARERTVVAEWEKIDPDIGNMTDMEVAKKHGKKYDVIRRRRRKLEGKVPERTPVWNRITTEGSSELMQRWGRA